MKYPNTLAATKATNIEALIDGLPVVGNGFFFTEQMLQNNEAALAANAATQARIDELTAQLNTANEARTAAETSLATANEQIVAKDGEISKLKTDLDAAENNMTFEETTREKDKTGADGKVPFHLSDENPANKIADGLIGKPKAVTQ